MNMVNLTINNMPVTVPEGTTILEAARSANIEIPTLCYLKDVNAIGSCRICVVEIKGARALAASCVYPVSEGMEVQTNTPKLRESRKMTLELILSNHEKKCLSCPRSQSCELQRLAKEYGCDDTYFEGHNIHYPLELSSPSIVRDNNKCILCRRCVAACNKIQGIGVIGPIERGFKTHIGCAFEKKLGDVACVNCGQCIVSCPVGALRENDETQKVWDAIADDSKHVVVSVAPAIRATLGEEFDMPLGSMVKGKIAAALRRMGFDGVFDLDVTADLTILEEGTEFLERLQNGGTLPLITSCSPGWIKYCEHYFPDFIPNLSSCKSPQQMFGAVIKTYYAQKMKINPKDIFMVNIIPCTAKKFETGREDQDAAGAGIPDVDVALTTRELAKMIKEAGIMFTKLPDEEFDEPFGIATGAGVIFGATGGVMEAALRTVVELVTGKELEKPDFMEVRGFDGIKEATYDVGGTEVKVAVASGLANAKKLLEAVRSGEKKYHFIEIMACPGGCLNGGGQPHLPDAVRNAIDYKAARAKAIYREDMDLPFRKSHESPVIKTLYDEFFEKPGSHKAHNILHTSYVARPKY